VDLPIERGIGGELAHGSTARHRHPSGGRSHPAAGDRAADLPEEAAEAAEVRGRVLEYVDELRRIYPFTKGVGIAAPQIGVSRAMAVVSPTGSPTTTLVNPVVVWSAARLALHEIDHLAGTLYVDRVTGDAAMVSVDEYGGSEAAWEY
jgi:peptide deformylase